MLPLNKIRRLEIRNLKVLFFDFDGVFTDNFVYVSDTGREQIKCSRLDGIGLSKIKTINLVPMIISSEKNRVVRARADKLEILCHQGVSDKAAQIIEVCREYGINPKDQLFLGNDENDIAAFKVVGTSIAVNDFYPTIADHVKYVTQTRGGYGAVREVCDLVYSLKLNGVANA